MALRRIEPLENWQERLIIERAELDSKIIKLTGFLYGEYRSPVTCAKVNAPLLILQLENMVSYLTILDARIDDFSMIDWNSANGGI